MFHLTFNMMLLEEIGIESTLYPLQLYLKDGRVKLELGLARGKKLHDKRETEARRDVDRRMRRAMLDS